MWQDNKMWLHYVKNIMAADVPSAVFLASYLKYSALRKDYVSYLEVIDLQKYRIIRQPPKVRLALRDRAKIPFVFVVGKN
jgi:hypothetical protein